MDPFHDWSHYDKYRIRAKWYSAKNVATLSATPSTTLTCAQTSLTLTAGGSSSYAFSGPGVVSQSGNQALVNAAGVYSVTVTNTTSGCASTTSITVSVANEMRPTTEAGPYTLQVYTDNPRLLQAQQAATPSSASFVYDWLAACNSSQPTPNPPGGDGHRRSDGDGGPAL